MKNNAFVALVILIIAIAFLFVVNDLSNTNDTKAHANVHSAHQQVDLVGLDSE